MINVDLEGLTIEEKREIAKRIISNMSEENKKKYLYLSSKLKDKN